MNTIAPTIAAPHVPPEVASRLSAWVLRRRHAIFLHYCVGVLGILSSVAAAADAYSRWASLWMVISSFCMGFMAFGNPRKEYSKFARAVRVLESAILRYRYHEPDMNALLAAVDRGEAIIENYENDEGPSLRQVREGLG
jgi:hypothetical protein